MNSEETESAQYNKLKKGNSRKIKDKLDRKVENRKNEKYQWSSQKIQYPTNINSEKDR